MAYISLDHPDRLRAILREAFGFLAQKGFVERASSYDLPSLSGNARLIKGDTLLHFSLHNDDLVIKISHAGDDGKTEKMSPGSIMQFLEQEPVDYAAFRAKADAPVAPRFESSWEYNAEYLQQHLDNLIAFIEAESYAERRMAYDAYHTARSAEFVRQMKAYNASRRSQPK